MWKATLSLVVIAATLALGCRSGGGEAAKPAMNVVGAGASFPYPLYAKWADAWQKRSQTRINYQSIGSGGGIQQIKAKTVDFGASDAPLDPKELDASGLVQFPAVIGGVVVVVHLSGVDTAAMVLDGDTTAKIFLGQITKWDSPELKALNPGLSLPSKDITVVHRADGSGTTWVFTNYLSKVSTEWKAKVGNDKAVSWPVGVGGKGNEGVSVSVQRVDGSIGYVEYAYALQNKLTAPRLKNAAGQPVKAGVESFQAAARSADWTGTPGMGVVLTNQSDKEAWPIVGASFILLHRDQNDAAKAKAILQFFDFGMRGGADMAKSLDYVPLPHEVVEQVQVVWTQTVRSAGIPVWNTQTVGS